MTNFTELSFKEAIKDHQVVLAVFSTDWCGPCRILTPIIDDLSKETNKAFIGKVNAEKNPELSNEYNVRSVPTLIFFKNGEIAERLVGLQKKADLQAIIDKLAEQ